MKVERIKKGLLVDLRKVYPAVESEMEDAVWDAFREDRAGTGYVDFIFYLLQGE